MFHSSVAYQALTGRYLFQEVARRRELWQETHPGRKSISLGIGDVTRPIPRSAALAMARAALEMARPEGVHGYGPEEGYFFLREVIAREEYRKKGIPIAADEIFLSDGAKSDCGGLPDLFAPDCVVGICDPAYAVYGEAHILSGKAGVYDGATGTWSGLKPLPCREEDEFLPTPPAEELDGVYLCSPNSPTGVAYPRAVLQQWVDWCRERGTLLIFDGAYESFLRTPGVPRSIFEIPGAEECAIELRSFSKTAGFTGVRCAYLVIPKTVYLGDRPLWELWKRRQGSKFNGLSYVTQRGAEALYTPEGAEQCRANRAVYQTNATRLRAELTELGLTVYGGIDAPYLWVKTPEGEPSWAFFDRLLEKTGLVVTPGAGFGAAGEGFVRLTAFSQPPEVEEALERLKDFFAGEPQEG